MILNLVLVAIPASVAALAYSSMQIELKRQADSYAHGPVTYETEFTGFSGPRWPMYAYFAVPNGILLASLIIRGRSQLNSTP